MVVMRKCKKNVRQDYQAYPGNSTNFNNAFITINLNQCNPQDELGAKFTLT